MQKVFNAMAVLSFLVSLGVVGGGIAIYCAKDGVLTSIKEQMKTQVIDIIEDIDVSGMVPDGEIPVETFSVPQI